MPLSVGRVLPLLFSQLFYDVPGTTCAAPYVVQARFRIFLNVSVPFITAYHVRHDARFMISYVHARA